jgi:hypothetical protein
MADFKSLAVYCSNLSSARSGTIEPRLPLRLRFEFDTRAGQVLNTNLHVPKCLSPLALNSAFTTMTSSKFTLAVVTGGSRGIGLSIAKRLATKHDILIVCRTAPSDDNVAELKAVRPDAVVHYVVGPDCAETQKVGYFQ